MEKFDKIFNHDIKTERLELRVLKPTIANAQMIWDVLKHEKSDDYQYMWHSVTHKSHLPESADETLELMKRDSGYKNGVVWYIFYHGQFIGYQRIHYWDNNDTIQCAGVWFIKSARGQGFNQEVHKLIDKLGFEELGVNRICRQAMEGNVCSVNSIKKAGYQLDGVERAANKMPDGTYMNHLLFSKLKSEYKGK
ncbi:MAG: GNAT family N-acetyltransferase [Alphaproteobacteria bacterium]|nr:GNAT family N-acetyltransferase [Alphaproteobacteria bacterium]